MGRSPYSDLPIDRLLRPPFLSHRRKRHQRSTHRTVRRLRRPGFPRPMAGRFSSCPLCPCWMVKAAGITRTMANSANWPKHTQRVLSIAANTFVSAAAGMAPHQPVFPANTSLSSTRTMISPATVPTVPASPACWIPTGSSLPRQPSYCHPFSPCFSWAKNTATLPLFFLLGLSPPADRR